ncbi:MULTISPECIES: class E sortase [unclassified Streptomyces]|uniref:class E sortase n=1 Tax=unclassified Streptomyces TaxID=2593676 RepID=UPI001E3651F9|nr:class E sortase [Streptomyces sp. CB02980]MCB8906444.1 class E sortase [Streptomyces sp. CB02980]
MRARVGQRVPVVVQSRGRRRTGARVLWVCAETVVTCGVVVLLLVVHQLWWTNQQARAEALQQVRVLEREWDISPPASTTSTTSPTSAGGPSSTSDSSSAGAPPVESGDPARRPTAGPVPGGRDVTPSSAFAVLRIPRLGLTVPVAHGVSKRSVLDKGYVGHYPGAAAPGRTGNFALAGHRNTHGEPFRYLDRLAEGDVISVRTRGATYTYRVDQILPRTAPRDVGVVRAVPRSIVKPSYGYDAPGAYLTLTTCTPEFSSAYRLVVWAKLVP